jgi:hypothetical protein
VAQLRELCGQTIGYAGERQSDPGLANLTTSSAPSARRRRPTFGRPSRSRGAVGSRELPSSCYRLEADGRLKAEFVTRDGARRVGKSERSMLQIRIYDAQTIRVRKSRSSVPILQSIRRSMAAELLAGGTRERARRHEVCRRRYHCPVPGYPFNRSRRCTRSRVPPSASRSCGCHCPLKRCAARTPGQSRGRKHR